MMLKTYEILHGFPDLKHIFCIPCDSHGVQLIVKDILTCIPQFKELLEKAQTIAKAFKNASLQYARLRQLQVEIYGQKRSLCLSVITRWGTQYHLVESLLKSKDALRRYAIAHEPGDLAAHAHDYINSSMFWASLESLRELLQPIDEALWMSESNQAHLEKVLDRWAMIHMHLNRMKTDFPILGKLVQVFGVLWNATLRSLISASILERLSAALFSLISFSMVSSRVSTCVGRGGGRGENSSIDASNFSICIVMC